MNDPVQIPPVQTVTCERDRLRVVLFVDPSLGDVRVDLSSVQKGVEEWLNGDSPLILFGMSKMELYEMPENYRSTEPVFVHQDC